MSDIATIKSVLNDNVLAVCKELLPGGEEKGGEYRCGSLDGGKGQSLGVHLRGNKIGVWCEFNGGESGDLIELWRKVKGQSLPDALADIRKRYGLELPALAIKPEKAYRQPAKPNCRKPEGVVRDYLTEVRNIPEASLLAYKIAEQGDRIIFPFIRPNGSLALVKTRKAADGEKPIPTEKDCEPILFGWQAIDENSREITICEGELDAPSLHAYGYPALSVPFGGGKGAKQQWIQNEFENLQRFEKIYLALDMDKPGMDAAEEIAARLGRHRCYLVKLPHKDANDCLMEGVSIGEIDEAFETAQSLDPKGLRQPMEFLDEVIDLFHPKEGQHVGYQAPYWKLRGQLFFQPGDTTVWTGSTGAGKSQVWSDCCVDWIKQGSRIVIASLEMKGKRTLYRMIKQLTGISQPTPRFIKAGLMELTGGLLIYDHVGKSSIDDLLEVFEYCRAKYGCDQTVTDSLMRLGLSADDYAGQEKSMFKLVNWTAEKNMHSHLVAHARKANTSSSGPPESEDIKGGMEIAGNAANVISIWRNKKREDVLATGEMDGERLSDAEINEFISSPGVILNVTKQRNGDFEGKVGLWFDQSSYRYYCEHNFNPMSRMYIDTKWDEASNFKETV